MWQQLMLDISPVPKDINFALYIVKGMQKTAETYEIYKDIWFDKIRKEPTVKTFIRSVLNLSSTQFFAVGDDMYGVKYDKKEETGDIYKCGKDCDVIIDTVEIKDIVNLIKESEENE